MKELIFKTAEIKDGSVKKRLINLTDAFFSGIFSNGQINSADVDISFSVGSDFILAEGEVKAKASFPCSRCLEKIEAALKDDFEQLFELSKEELDLSETVKETLAMMEPMSLRCKEKCGEDLIKKYSLNDSFKEQKNPFKSLKGLKFRKKEK